MFCIKPLCRMPGMHRHRHSRETLSAALEQPESRSTPGEGDGYDRLMDAHIWNKKARRDLFANVCHLAAVFLCSSFLVLDADFRCRLLAFQSVPILENMRQDSLIGGPAVSAGISSGRAAIKYSHLALTKKRKVFVSCSPRLCKVTACHTAHDRAFMFPLTFWACWAACNNPPFLPCFLRSSTFHQVYALHVFPGPILPRVCLWSVSVCASRFPRSYLLSPADARFS